MLICQPYFRNLAIKNTQNDRELSVLLFKIDYIEAPVDGVVDPAQQALHLAHGHPKILTTAEIPTTMYTIASTIGHEPKIIFTRLSPRFISMPTPTRPQLSPPTISNTFAIILTPHPHFPLQLHVIYKLFELINNKDLYVYIIPYHQLFCARILLCYN